MSNDVRVLDLVESILDTDVAPEEACADCPELLPAVKAKLQEFRRLEQHMEAMFPPTDTLPDPNNGAAPSGDDQLPAIPGYEMQSRLGSGGMGVVYQARHLSLSRDVALKMLLLGAYAGPADKARFRREAEAVARLRNPNIVQIHDIGEVNGRPYFTMELVEGGSLSQKLGGAPQPNNEAAALLSKLARAVNAAHQAGVVHCDLKPGNVLLTLDGTPKISDFGLAKLQEGEHGLTLSGSGSGTPSYMAPEQAVGQTGRVGPACDVYGLGSVLYEALTGRPPFRAATPIETLRQVVSEEPAPPKRLNAHVALDLQTICLKCLEKDPERRYATAADLADDLDRFLASEPIHARPVGVIGRAYRWAKRNRSLAVMLAVVAALLLVLVVASLWAASYFRSQADANHKIAVQLRRALRDADLATNNANHQRLNAESLTLAMKRSLYFTEMQLSGQSMHLPRGLSRVAERLAHWRFMTPDLRQWEWFYLHGLSHRSETMWRVNSEGVLAAEWDREGRRLATGDVNHQVCIWPADATLPTLRMRGHSSEVVGLAWSPDGAKLASASSDRTVRVWDATTGAELTRFDGHASGVNGVAWSPDGQSIASSSDDKTVQVWDVATGSVRLVLRGHEESVSDVVWHPTRNWIASCSYDTLIHLWNAETGEPIRRLDGHVNWVMHLALSHDGAKLASTSNDCTTQVWNPETGEVLTTLVGHAHGVSDVSWSPDDRRLATCSDDSTLKVWNAENGAEIATLRGHTTSLTAVSWRPDGASIASASFDGVVRIWPGDPTSSDAAALQHDDGVACVAWRPQPGGWFATAQTGGMVRVWNEQHRLLHELDLGEHKRICSIAWHPVAERLAIGASDGRIRIWDCGSDHPPTQIETFAGNAFSVAWSPDGQRLAAGSEDNRVRVWNLAEGGEPVTCVGHEHYVYAVAWSPDGKRLASGSSDRTMRIWDPVTGKEASCHRGHTSDVLSVAWSPDGKTLATTGYDQTVRLWEPQITLPLKELRGHTAHVSQVVWSPDGRRLATACRDGVVKIWDPETSMESLSFEDHKRPALSVAWSPDGMTVASGGEDRKVFFHDAIYGYTDSRNERVLSIVDRRLQADPQNRNDWRLRTEINIRRRAWDQAAADAQRVLQVAERPWWVFDGYVAQRYVEVDARVFGAESPAGDSAATYRELAEAFKSINWQRLPEPTRGWIDLGRHCGHQSNVSGCVMFPIYCEKEEQAALLLGSDDSVMVWLNGRRTFEWRGSRMATPDSDAVAVTLRPGWNALFFQVFNDTGDHGLHWRLSNAESDLQRVRPAQ